MKQSGIDWIGEIPDDWKTRQIRYLFSLRDERNYKPLSEVNLISVYTDKGVLQHSDIEQTTGNKAQNADGYKHVYKNDLVVNIILCWMGALGISDFDGVTSPAYDVYAPKDLNTILPKYYHYLFRTPQFNGKCYTEGRGIMQMRWRTYSSEFKSIKVPLPPKATQQRIAEYLDSKCAQIDSIIEESKKSIEEYKAWKQSVIFEAVNCKKKDSGIEWIGEIPEGWGVKRIKNEFENLDYLREPISAENRNNKQGLYDYYGASGVIDKIDDFNVDDTVLLIGEDGANLRMRNLPLIYRASGKFWVNNHAHILKVKNDNDYSYMAYLLEAGDYNNYITGAAQPKLSQSNLMSFPLLVPPIPDQESIAKMLDSKCAQIDSLIAEKESLIADLTEYKKSLIFEVVTGKRSV